MSQILTPLKHLSFLRSTNVWHPDTHSADSDNYGYTKKIALCRGLDVSAGHWNIFACLIFPGHVMVSQ